MSGLSLKTYFSCLQKWESPFPALSERAELARCARAHRTAVPSPLPRGEPTVNLPKTTLSSQGNEKVIKCTARNGRRRRRKDGDAGASSASLQCCSHRGPIPASRKRCRHPRVIRAGRLAVTFKCHFQMPAPAKWLQNAVFALDFGERRA